MAKVGMHFKKGQKVKLKKELIVPGFDLTDERIPTLGNIYTIEKIARGNAGYLLFLGEISGSWYAHRFELVGTYDPFFSEW